MDVAKRLAGSFVVGGAIGLVTQVLFVIGQMVAGPNIQLAMVVGFVLLGIVTTVLFMTGVYEKIEKVGYFGATLPFSGLVSGVAHLYLGGKAEGGVAGGLKAGLKLLIGILGLGTVVALVVGVVYGFIF